jgi:3-hydroxybutyrate dehydrogenase
MLLGKAALVTGSTSGLGLSVVKALAGAGCSVAMHGFGDPAEINRMRETIAGENGVKVMYR